MSLEELRASINSILDEIERRPADRIQLQADLKDRVAQLSELAEETLPMPKTAVSRQDPDLADDYFDNLPI